MGFELQIVHHTVGDYVSFTATGTWTLRSVYDLIDTVRQECARFSVNRALVDIRQLGGMPSEMDRYNWGVRAATVIGGRVRVAVLARADQINRFGENTAVNRGADINTLTDADEALRWMMQRPAG